MIRERVKSLLDEHSKWRHLARVRLGARVLDVGCGNHSPTRFKRLRPDINYTGIDVGKYNLDHFDESVADRLVYSEPERFVDEIAAFGPQFDLIVSAHNIEHVNDPLRVLEAMARALTTGGELYLSFPSAASVSFPSRRGTLNFHDDATHRWVPDLANVVETISSSGLGVETLIPRNRGIIPWTIGLLVEPFSRALGRTLPFTWNFWGFEAIVVGRKGDPLAAPCT